jgi:hypothetical protein
VLGTDAQPAFYIEASDVGVLDEFLAAARAAVERVMRMPLVKGLLDTLDLAVEGEMDNSKVES